MKQTEYESKINYFIIQLSSQVLELIKFPLFYCLEISVEYSEKSAQSKMHYLLGQLHEKLSLDFVFQHSILTRHVR